MQGNLAIRYSWDDRPLDDAECVSVSLRRDSLALHVSIDSPYYADPSPAAAPGSLEGLWDYEVVELFLLGDGDRYLELEFGPHGHYLAIDFRAARVRHRSGLDIGYRCAIRGARWHGDATIAREQLPSGLRACNAYAIHGVGSERRHLACHPVAGAAPDFHRLECFGALPDA